MTRLVPILLLAACAGDAELPMDQLPPASGYDAFVVGDLLANIPTKVTWEDPDLDPGTVAVLYVSPNGTGAGPCPGVLTECLGITQPLIRVATARVQPPNTLTGALSGTTYTTDPYVVFDVRPPAALGFGDTVGFQAGGRNASGDWFLSPAIDKTSTITPCSFLLAPVCGVDGASYGNDCNAASAGAVVATPPPDGCSP
jgi:hypothetical protein